MTDVARLQIAVDSRQALTAAQNLAAMGTSATRVSRVIGNLSKANLFSGVKESASKVKGEFDKLETNVESFGTKIQDAAGKFDLFREAESSLKGAADGAGAEVSKVARAVETIAGAGGGSTLSSFAEGMNAANEGARKAAPSIKLLAKYFRSLRDSASGISTSGNSFATSLSSLVTPANNASKALISTATGAQLTSVAMSNLAKLNVAEGILDTAVAAEMAAEEYNKLKKPLEGIVTELTEFATATTQTAASITLLKEDLGAVAGSFEGIFSQISRLNQKENKQAFKDIGDTVSTFGTKLRNAVEPLNQVATALKGIVTDTTGLNRRLSTINERLDLMDQNAGAAAPKLERLREELRQVKDQAKEVAEQTKGAARGIRSTGTAVASLDKVNDSFGRIRASARGAGNFVRQFATGLGLVSGGFALALGAKGFVNALKDFEFQAAKTAAVAIKLGTTYDKVAQSQRDLEQQSRSLGATSRFTAVEASEAQFFLARAGFTVDQVLKATPATLELAAAGYLGLAEAADIASNVLKQFSLETEQLQGVTDSLVATANNANTSVEQMAQALSYAGPFAANLGVSVDEASAAIGALGNAGIQGSLAGTNLRGILIALTSPSKEAGEALDRLAARIGKTRAAFDVTSNDLTEVISNLREATAGTDTVAKDFAAIFQRRNVSGALALVENVEGFEDLLDTLGGAAGEAARITDQVDDTLAGAFLRAKAAVVEFSLAAGDEGAAGTIRNVVDAFTEAVRFLGGSREAFLNLSEGAKTTINVLKGVAAAITLLAASVVGGAFTKAISRFDVLGAKVKSFSRNVQAANIRVSRSFKNVGAAAGVARVGVIGLKTALRAIPTVAAAAVIFELGTAMFDLLTPTDQVTLAIERQNEATREQIKLAKEQAGLVNQASGVEEQTVITGNLRARGAKLSSIVSASKKEEAGLKALIERLGETSDGVGILAGSLDQLLPTYDQLTQASQSARDSLKQLYEDAEVPVDQSQINALAAAYRKASNDVVAARTELAAFKRELAEEQGLDQAQLEVGDNIRAAFDATITDKFAPLLRKDGADRIAELGVLAKNAVEDNLRLSPSAKERLKEDIDAFSGGAINDLAQGTLIKRAATINALKEQLVQAIGTPIGAGEFAVLDASQTARLEQLLKINAELRAAEKVALGDVVTQSSEVKGGKEFERKSDILEVEVLQNLKDQAFERERLEGLEGAALRSAKQRLAIEAKFAELQGKTVGDFDPDKGVPLPKDVEEALAGLSNVAVEKEVTENLDKQRVALDRIVDRATNRTAQGREALANLRVQAGLQAQVDDTTLASLRAERELQKLKQDQLKDIDASELSRIKNQLIQNELTAIQNKKYEAASRAIITQRKATDEVGAKLLETLGIARQYSAEQEAINTLKLQGASYSDRELKVLTDLIELERKRKAEIKDFNDRQVLRDLQAETTELTLRNLAAQNGQQITESYWEAYRTGAELGRLSDADFMAQLRAGFAERERLTKRLEAAEQARQQLKDTDEFIAEFQRETEAIIRQAYGIEEMTAAERALRIVKDENLAKTPETLAAIEAEITARDKANARLKQKEIAEARAREVSEAITAKQRELAGALVDVAKNAGDVEDAMKGFAASIIEAIAQAQIFKALAATGLFDADGLLGAPISAGIISRQTIEQQVNEVQGDVLREGEDLLENRVEYVTQYVERVYVDQGDVPQNILDANAEFESQRLGTLPSVSAPSGSNLDSVLDSVDAAPIDFEAANAAFLAESDKLVDALGENTSSLQNLATAGLDAAGTGLEAGLGIGGDVAGDIASGATDAAAGATEAAGAAATAAGLQAGAAAITAAGSTAGAAIGSAGTTAATALNQAALAITTAAAKLAAAAKLSGVTSYKGNVFADGAVSNKFYNGGIPGLDELPKVGSIPQTFRGSDGSINSLREGGSTEAILPLGRDGQGRLGVRMTGGDMGGNSQTITNNSKTVQNFNMTLPEDTFGRSDRQRRRMADRQSRR